MSSSCRLFSSVFFALHLWAYMQVTEALGVDNVADNPCTKLPSNPSAQEQQEANAYCKSVLRRFLMHPVNAGPKAFGLDPEKVGCHFTGTSYSCNLSKSYGYRGGELMRTALTSIVKGENTWWSPRWDQILIPDLAPTILAPKDIEILEQNKWEQWTENAAVYSTQGKRPGMEDRFSIDDDMLKTGVSFYAVFDGHGGEYAAEYAKNHLKNNLAKEIHAIKTLSFGDSTPEKAHIRQYLLRRGGIDYEKLLYDVILSTDQELIASGEKAKKKTGTTAIIAIVDGSKLVVANVGDSRAIMCDSEGYAIPLSFDHKPNLPAERTRIEEFGGTLTKDEDNVWRVNHILSTSRALGNDYLKDFEYISAIPEILTFDMTTYRPEFIVLASDGLWDDLRNEEVVAVTKQRLGEEHFGAKSLAHLAFKRGSVDNITVVVAKMTQNRPSSPASAIFDSQDAMTERERIFRSLRARGVKGGTDEFQNDSAEKTAQAQCETPPATKPGAQAAPKSESKWLETFKRTKSEPKTKSGKTSKRSSLGSAKSKITTKLRKTFFRKKKIPDRS